MVEVIVQKTVLILILISICTFLVALEWENALPIRQGVNIEWFRTGTETGDGGAIYVWSDTKLGERDLYAQKVDANGNMVWGQPLLVDGKPDRQEDPVITRTSDNNFIIAWIDFSNDPDGSVFAQKVNSNGVLMWPTGGVSLCSYPGIQISLNIEPDNAGGAYIVWEDSRNPGKDIYGQHVNSQGNVVWVANGIPIANSAGDESYNTMWADGTGGLIIGYVHALNSLETLYVKRFLPDGQMAWTQPVSLSPSASNQNKIKMSPINNDSFVFTWMDFRLVHPDIYAQRVDLNGNLLWPDPFVVYTDSTGAMAPQENPRIVQTSDSGVIIVWEDKRNDLDDPDLFAQKVSLSGQLLWNLDGVPLAVAPFGQKGPRMAADNSGGCFVVWDDARNGNAPNIDIYAQHLTSTGLSAWSNNGLAVCVAPNEQSGSLVKVSNNNLFVNWMDLRNGSVGIYYQVLNSSGEFQLADNGIQVFWGLSGDATLKQIIHLPRQNDTAVIWQDTRYGNLGKQIFVQIINQDGTVDLDVNGKAVTTLTGHDQNFPSAVVLPDDKIAIVWEEKRTNNPKIYAQLISANGDRLWGEQGIAVTDSEPLRQKDAKVSYLDGAIYIGWSNLDDVTTTSGNLQLFHIWGQKIENNQKMWGPNGYLISEYPTSDPYFECQLETIVGRHFVWTRTSIDMSNYGALNVWAKLVTSDGQTAPGWSQYGVCTSNYNDYDLNQYLPKATLTDTGLFVIWLDFRTDFIKNMYGQMISPTGQILWNPSGIPLNDFGREQDDVSVLGGQEITFTWKESLTGSNQDIMMQRYSTLGNPVWTASGNFIVQRDTTQSSPNLARFSNGRMVVAWEDYVIEDADIYMKFINADGTLVDSNPADPGILVSNAIKIQQYPQIAILNQSNSGIIIWSDGRSSGKEAIYGIYAQKFYMVSNSDDNASVPQNIIQLSKSCPNPFVDNVKISFSLSKDSKNVDLSVYNIKGQKVKTLHNGRTLKGNYTYTWDGKDAKGNSLATGVYFCSLHADRAAALTEKLIYIK
jgi:hypothetical protein